MTSVSIPDVNTTHPDKKSIMTYVMCLFQVLPHDTVDMLFADPSYTPAAVTIKQVGLPGREGRRARQLWARSGASVSAERAVGRPLPRAAAGCR